MSVRARIRSTLRSLFRKEELARELDEELRHYLESLVEEKMRRGLSREAATREARLELGGVEQVKEKVREIRLGTGLDTFGQDVRYAVRTLRTHPGFALIAILSLALGIGANTTIFSLYNSILLRRPPLKEIDRFVEVYTREQDSDDLEFGPSSYADYLDLQEQTTDVFDAMVIYNTTMPILEGPDANEYVLGEVVSTNYFDVVGIRPALGRFFDPSIDGAVGAPPTVVIGHHLWQSHFGSDPGVIGRVITITGLDFTVIGVAPKGFGGLFPMEAGIWYPITLRPLINSRSTELTYRGERTNWIKARLRDGIGHDEARAALTVIAARLEQEHPDTNTGCSFKLVPSNTISLHPQLDGLITGFTLFLMVMVGLVLLIACTNLASMLLARALSRRREIGIRLAMGAGRFRLIRQLLTESILLALLGGMLGLVLTYALLHLLLAVQPPIPIHISVDLGLDVRVLAFTVALSFVTGIIFGLIPALQSTRFQLMGALRDEYGVLTRRLRRVSLRSGLVVAQVAVSALLMVFAGLFLRSLSRANRVDTGFDLRQGVVGTFILYESGLSAEEGQSFFQRLIERVSTLPGVESVAMTDRMPLGYGISTTSVHPQNSDVEIDADGVSTDFSLISAGYFETMGIPILSGRAFTTMDQGEGEEVVIVNETFARAYWPAGTALGQYVRVGDAEELPRRIVGIARDGRYRSLGERTRPYIYFPVRDRNLLIGFLIVRSSLDGKTLLQPVREAIREVDRHVPLLDLATVSRHLELMLVLPRLLAGLLTGLGLFSLVLGTTGLYGVVAYDVSCRVREVGIRMSLGAQRSQVLRLIIGDGLKLVLVGSALGLGLAWLTSRSLASMLIGIRPGDPVTYGLVEVLFLLVALIATWQPAHTASTVDPIEALHKE
jgi:macrolide transport system ATP-binding/permease protein